MLKIKELAIVIGASVASSIVTAAATVFVLSGSGAALEASAGITQESVAPPALTGQASVARGSDSFSELIHVCQSDVQKFCTNGLSTGGKAVCLRDHFDEVSGACHTQIQANRDKNFAPCKDDIARFCASAGYGGGRMMNCLRAAAAKLSQSCAAMVKRS